MKGDTRESHTRARQKTMTENLLVSLNDVEEKEASTSEDSPAAKYAKAYSERMSTVNPEFE